MTTSRSQLLRIAQGATAGALFAISVGTLAKSTELDTGVRYIPYAGTLERNGAGYTGIADFTFTVTGSVRTDAGIRTWTEQHDDVNVYGGKFSVKLGEKTKTGNTVTGVPDWVFDDTAVSISLSVRDGSSTGSFTALTGSQRLYPTPFAYWAAEGSDMKVDGVLDVRGADLTLGKGDGRYQGTNTANLALVHSVDNQDALVVNWGGSFEGGTRVQSKLSVTDKLTVDTGGFQVTAGDSQLGGNLTVTTGNLTLNNGKATVSSSTATEVLSLASTTGSEVSMRFRNNGAGQWTIGAGGSVGTNDFFFYSPSSNLVAMEIESDGDVAVTKDLTVAGYISHKTQCPGTPNFTAQKDNEKSKLCVYREDTYRTWREAVRYCWDNVYGSQLCSLAQLRIACMSGMSLAIDHWTSDPAIDDEAFEVNRTDCDNFDGDVSVNDPNGSYCCLYLRAD